MTYEIKSLSCDPAKIKGMSERLIVDRGTARRARLRQGRRLSHQRPQTKALGGGSGWVLLSWSPRDRKLLNQWASDHCHTLAGGTAILALDMYEHSYHIDFGAKAASYVDTFMDVIRWNNVERLLVQMTNGRGLGSNTRQ